MCCADQLTPQSIAAGRQRLSSANWRHSAATRKYPESSHSPAGVLWLPYTSTAFAIWFNENPISAPEAENFQISAHADETKDGKQRTLVQIMFCPDGGATTASATAVKSIDLNTNHAKSPLLGVQWSVESPKDFKVEKMTGEIKPGGALAGKIVGSRGKTTWNLDFDVKVPAKEASAGMSCGK
jgi:hypothetical protein